MSVQRGSLSKWYDELGQGVVTIDALVDVRRHRFANVENAWVEMLWHRSRVFFFQAEDGIRDWSVTGVQTCALPIWLSPCASWLAPRGRLSAARSPLFGTMWKRTATTRKRTATTRKRTATTRKRTATR